MTKAIENERRRCAVLGAPSRSMGPVKSALRVIRGDTPGQRELRALRGTLEVQIAAGIGIFDRLDAGERRS